MQQQAAAAAAAVGEEEGAEGAQQQHDVLAVDDDDGGGDADVESPMSTSLNLTTHQLVRETEAGSTCADKWLAEVLEREAGLLWRALRLRRLPRFPRRLPSRGGQPVVSRRAAVPPREPRQATQSQQKQ